MEQIKRIVLSLSVRQRWTILIAGILAAAGFYGLAHWQTESSFRPLYNSLAPEDAAVVVQKLKEEGVPYRLSINNSTISVPEDKVAELRLEMAGAGVPKNGRIGFEIFDKTNFGMTDFAEHINYRRALEGELERSVMSISQVEQARVHISFPQESVFTEARQPAKASVLVKIRPGDVLPDSAVPAITNLISSAVEGLAPESVSVLDMRGNLLNRAKRTNGSGEDLSDSALEYRHKVEQDLTAKLNSTLEPLVGAGRFRAAVSADCDLTSGEQSEESFDPTHSVMVSSQTTQDSSSTTRMAEGGIPGTASNLPETAPKPSAGGSGTSRKTENVNYETSRTVKRTVLPQGAIKRLSVSVLIDQEARWEGIGAAAKRVLVPPPPERLKVIHDLAAAATGLNTDRGDQLIVESLPFESTLNLDQPGSQDSAPPPPAGVKKPTLLEQLKSDPKIMIGAAAILVVFLGGGLFVIRSLVKASAGDSAKAYVVPALPQAAGEAGAPQLARASGASEQDSWTPSSSASSPLPALAPGRIEVLTKNLRETAQKDAEICAGVLRGWLKEERT
jgi:flagellar M-ring protein FliF